MVEKLWETIVVILGFCWMGESCQGQGEQNTEPIAPRYTINKHELVKAFIFVESSGNDYAVNARTKATGCLQIMPIMIREANRLVGAEKYKLSDRTNRSKSVEIFHLVMAAKNPDYDIARACIIWNPNGGYNYLLKVENEYNKLIKK